MTNAELVKLVKKITYPRDRRGRILATRFAALFGNIYVQTVFDRYHGSMSTYYYAEVGGFLIRCYSANDYDAKHRTVVTKVNVVDFDVLSQYEYNELIREFRCRLPWLLNACSFSFWIVPRGEWEYADHYARKIGYINGKYFEYQHDDINDHLSWDFTERRADITDVELEVATFLINKYEELDEDTGITIGPLQIVPRLRDDNPKGFAFTDYDVYLSGHKKEKVTFSTANEAFNFGVCLLYDSIGHSGILKLAGI